MAADPVEAAAFAALDRLAGDRPALGVAVSGGSDSTALLHLAAAWGRARGIRVEAATVDHGLRPEAGAEAAAVARASAELGVAHRTLHWDGRAAQGNLMAAARQARLDLLGQWALSVGLSAVALGHTQDDQAETLLMRLARGAGVDGLSGMAEARQQGRLVWLRPLLALRRADLRDWLSARGIVWADDPTNDDSSYDRVRARKAIASLGLPVEALVRSAAYLAEARAALAEAAVAAAQGYAADRGLLRLPDAVLAASPETRRRLIVAALRWVNGADYPPRGEDVLRLIAALAAGGQATLDGVIARRRTGCVEFLREPAAAQAARAIENSDQQTIWDDRWTLTGVPAHAVVRSTQEPDLIGRDWRTSSLPRLALLSAPTVESGGRVVLPLLEPGPISASPLRDAAAFAAILRAH